MGFEAVSKTGRSSGGVSGGCLVGVSKMGSFMSNSRGSLLAQLGNWDCKDVSETWPYSAIHSGIIWLLV